ncbi:MAG: hypothetical protein IJU19_07145 [Bacteroidales bacterium]|nr:hypothetical protein [Bacteroidales bacterium]
MCILRCETSRVGEEDSGGIKAAEEGYGEGSKAIVEGGQVAAGRLFAER